VSPIYFNGLHSRGVRKSSQRPDAIGKILKTTARDVGKKSFTTATPDGPRLRGRGSQWDLRNKTHAMIGTYVVPTAAAAASAISELNNCRDRKEKTEMGQKQESHGNFGRVVTVAFGNETESGTEGLACSRATNCWLSGGGDFLSVMNFGIST